MTLLNPLSKEIHFIIPDVQKSPMLSMSLLESSMILPALSVNPAEAGFSLFTSADAVEGLEVLGAIPPTFFGSLRAFLLFPATLPITGCLHQHSHQLWPSFPHFKNFPTGPLSSNKTFEIPFNSTALSFQAIWSLSF